MEGSGRALCASAKPPTNTNHPALPPSLYAGASLRFFVPLKQLELTRSGIIVVRAQTSVKPPQVRI